MTSCLCPLDAGTAVVSNELIPIDRLRTVSRQ